MARPTRTQQLKKPLKRIAVEVPEEFLPKKYVLLFNDSIQSASKEIDLAALGH